MVNIIDKSGDSEQHSNINFSSLCQNEKYNLQLRLKVFGVINNGETLYITCLKNLIVTFLLIKRKLQ